MAEYTLDSIAERMRMLDEQISRTSVLLETFTSRSDTPFYDHYMDFDDASYDEYEREEIMSDVSNDDTIPYLNEFDDGEIDEFDDDETIVPDYQDPFWTPPFRADFFREPTTQSTVDYLDDDDL
jgi:hypothetical protein